ncbi:glycogen branching protein [Candidatus Endoriftia persephone str. Guaymas]|uniref:1,4-alpha-glucan branching enzyme GlgB n=2 Tax=Gammaproteobacteria TaxID=1236 RepID=G2FCH8_9GAMM|nr:1,4-alpha-glucan branching protein GlgB [Candidatus Endoriftia persephone]EGW55541.1 1,4-alpha-glucan-branching enzyme [endosymbiont of Tevnia jerichonana (vent Tica)]MBA1331638.1 glycogen branching protein [Candidatus Endoriftia persephone str. Guaymas]USF86691.1 1,4-alpha-glucan branching protein GlgB [Candidatus Endoriftia persephone]
MTQVIKATVAEPLQRIIEARHHDPFEVLGRHLTGKKVEVTVFLPRARKVTLSDIDEPLERIEGTDLFRGKFKATKLPERYQLEWFDEQGARHQQYDPYCFTPQLPDFDLHLFGEGRHRHAYRFLGAHPWQADGIDGVLFSVWAPIAQRVSVVGDFNQWDGRTHSMRVRGSTGIWELFIPGIGSGHFYKFEIRTHSGEISLRSDPYGNAFQLRPESAGIICAETYQWQDQGWLESRRSFDWQHQPMSVYEVHLGSWQRDENGDFLNYRELAHRLCDYVQQTGFTHIELLPITEHPLDASWGYQTTGYFAPTSRFGSPDDFRYFVDHLHQHGIGVILDWVPAHFPRDRHALARFDGSALYEHEDPRQGEHQDWGTLIFNFGRNEVRNFLISSAVYWLEEFHIDGLRVDAVASMLYLDYSREAGDWIPNKHGGRENLEAVDFLHELNSVTHELHPGSLMIAEESTAWPQVSRPTWLGGLGFSMKWNMGWMHDSLSYMSKDPVYRHYHHDLLTFGLLYSFTENFMLPFSHDEVVHGKGSMINKMPGDEWRRFASLRQLYTYMFTYPGKKLLFMGNEFGQINEWNEASSLDWVLTDTHFHGGLRQLVGDLNRLYREQPALHQLDFESSGFEWIDCHDSSQSVLSYLRKGTDGSQLVVILNFTPVPRENYRIGLPQAGSYREILNSDSKFYAGSNLGNDGQIQAEQLPWMNQPHSTVLRLPPLGAIVLKPEG